jgi:hypothetical protein
MLGQFGNSRAMSANVGEIDLLISGLMGKT